MKECDPMKNIKIIFSIVCSLVSVMNICNAETITFEPYTDEEKPYLIDGGTHSYNRMVTDFGAAFLGDLFRFADGNTYWIYKFEFNRAVQAVAKIDISAEYKISIAMSDAGNPEDYIVVLEEKNHVHNRANREVKTIKYGDYFKAPGRKVWMKFEDSIPSDGWGPYLDSFTLEYTLGVSVESTGKLTTTWGKTKAESK